MISTSRERGQCSHGDTPLQGSGCQASGLGHADARGCCKHVSPRHRAAVFPIIKCKVASRFPFSPSPALLLRCPRKGPGGYLLLAPASSYLTEPRGSCLCERGAPGSGPAAPCWQAAQLTQRLGQTWAGLRRPGSGRSPSRKPRVVARWCASLDFGGGEEFNVAPGPRLPAADARLDPLCLQLGGVEAEVGETRSPVGTRIWAGSRASRPERAGYGNFGRRPSGCKDLTASEAGVGAAPRTPRPPACAFPARCWSLAPPGAFGLAWPEGQLGRAPGLPVQDAPPPSAT